MRHELDLAQNSCVLLLEVEKIDCPGLETRKGETNSSNQLGVAEEQQGRRGQGVACICDECHARCRDVSVSFVRVPLLSTVWCADGFLLRLGKMQNRRLPHTFRVHAAIVCVRASFVSVRTVYSGPSRPAGKFSPVTHGSTSSAHDKIHIRESVSSARSIRPSETTK